MEIIDLVESFEFVLILKGYNAAKENRKEFELGFNVFSLVSDTYYRENFHSQIIHTFLNPAGKHNEGKTFLHLFIEFIQKNFNKKIELRNYQDSVEVCNELEISVINGDSYEKGRIDILIQSKTNAIIIENKMNNAVDMENQLVKYYLFCKGGSKETQIQEREIDAIIYLSLDGNKTPDRSKWNCDPKGEIRKKIENVLFFLPAFDINPSKPSLFDWLEKCRNTTQKSESKFIISQYNQLLKSLRGFIMETNELEKFFNYISKDNSKAKNIETIVEMYNMLPFYYPQRLQEAISSELAEKGNNFWFTRSKVYEDTSLIFENLGMDINYYLKIGFVNNKTFRIEIRDNSKTWEHDEKIKTHCDFMNLFDSNDDFWLYKESTFDLINKFEDFIEIVRSVLKMTAEIIRAEKNQL